MCLLCPDSPLMNASRHVVELVGEELVQVEFVEAVTLCDEPPELLLEELPDLVTVLPELLEELPDLVTVLPELLEELPDLVTVLPELLEELPDATAAAPELLPLEELPELLEEALTELLPAAVTCIEKAGSPLVAVPSLAVMTMLLYWPVSGALGVPESSPVVSPKVAQTGLFWMPKLRGMRLGFATVG
jgi:hypothetical protein